MTRYKIKSDGFTCDVLVYKNLNGMKRAIYKRHGVKNPNGVAFSLTLVHDRYAELYFYEDGLSIDTVAHEFFHVAFQLAIIEVRGRSALYRRQEKYAELHSELIRLFWNKWYGAPSHHSILLDKPTEVVVLSPNKETT